MSNFNQQDWTREYFYSGEYDPVEEEYLRKKYLPEYTPPQYLFQPLTVNTTYDSIAPPLEQKRTLFFDNIQQESTSKLLNYINGMIETIEPMAENQVLITFIDNLIATKVLQMFLTQKVYIDNEEIKAQWGPLTTFNPDIYSKVLKGASRNVFINNLDPIMTSQWLAKELLRFGTVETVRILSEKRIGFVHMYSIESAINAVTVLQQESQWASSRIFYGRDRCGDYIENLEGFKEEQKQNRGKGDQRTVYLGGIKPGSIRGGMLQHIRYLEEKNVAFATFIYPLDARLFFEYAIENSLVIKSKKVKVGWGNPSTLPASLSTSVKEGATRNVYIGGLDLDTTEEELEKVFGLFGEIEMINFKPQKGYGFVSFTDISCAIRAVVTLQTEGKYLDCKIGYGKDRCGLPLRSNGAMTPPTSPVIFDYLQ